jgi:ABC-type antimicrobial peptide transport system permease subunit
MLNPLLYYIKNKGKGLLLLFAIVVCVLGVVFVSTIILSISDTCKPLMVYPYENITAVRLLNDDKPDAESELSEKAALSDCIPMKVSVFDFKLITVSSSSMIMNFEDKTDIGVIMDKCAVKLTEGVLPEKGKNEIIVHENILKNKKLKLGDELNSYQITGSFSGKPVFGLGYMDSSAAEEEFKQPRTYIVFADNDVRSRLKELSADDWKVYTIDDANQDLDNSFSDLNLILAISIIMLTISISIAIAALVFSQYASRYDEFAILNTIGYKKKSIIALIIKEIMIISIVGWAIGYGLALLGIWLVYINVYRNTGQTMNIFNIVALKYSFVPLICSVLFTLIPTTRKICKTDLISIIERRN